MEIFKVFPWGQVEGFPPFFVIHENMLVDVHCTMYCLVFSDWFEGIHTLNEKNKQ